MTQISNAGLAPQAILCFKKDEHHHEELPPFTLNQLCCLSKAPPPISSFSTEKLLLIGENAPHPPANVNKIPSNDPSLLKIRQGLGTRRIKVLSNGELNIEDSAYCKNPNENLIQGLKQRTTTLMNQLEFAVLYRIISFKICLIAYSKKGLKIKKESTSTQSGNYLSPNHLHQRKRSLDSIVTELRFFDECHIAAIPAIKNSHSKFNQIIEDIENLEVDVILEKYSISKDQSIYLEVIKIFATKQGDELINAIAQILTRPQLCLCGNASSRSIFKRIFDSKNHEGLTKKIYSLQPDIVKRFFIEKYASFDDRKHFTLEQSKESKKHLEDYYFSITGEQLNSLFNDKTQRRIIQRDFKDKVLLPILLKLIIEFRKENSSESDELNSILEFEFPEKKFLRSFIFDNLGTDYKEIKTGIFDHLLPLNSLAGTMLSQTIFMGREINQGIDKVTDELALKLVPKLLTNFGSLQDADEVALDDAIAQYKQNLIDAYTEYAGKVNSNTSNFLPHLSLEEAIENIPMPDSEMQSIFNELNKDSSLYDLVTIGLSYLGHLSDLGQDQVKIGDVLNFMTDPNAMQRKIDDLEKALNVKFKDFDHLRMLESFRCLLSSLDNIKTKIDNLKIPEDILNKKIETAPYGSLHNFITQHKAAIADYCSRVVNSGDSKNFEATLLGENLTLDDSNKVAIPVVDFQLCEGQGDQFCWERVQ